LSSGSCPIRPLFDTLRVLFKTHAADDRARAILVTTLYTQPSSLAIGALCGILTSATAAIESGNRSITLAAWVMSAIALMRVASATILPRWMAHKARALEIIYELGAFSYSIMAGMIAALTFFHPVPGPVRTLMVGNAIAYSVGIAARNAGRPAIAIGQLALALLPVIVAAGMQTDLASQLLAFTLFLVLPAMMSITLNVFRTLRDSIASAETSQRLAEKMQHLARTDIVTGLLNRAGLNHHLVERLVAIPEGNKLAILWLDLDRFKEINDTLGHQVGDRCLVEVAARLRRSAPVGAGIGRFGGDEFIIAFEAASDAVIKGVADTILNDILRPLRIDDDRLEIGCSIGIAILPEHGTDLEAVLQGADLALNHAKLNGRKQIVSFNPAMTRDLIRRKEIEAELRLALQRDELSVHFQPLVDLETGRIRAFEALVRWFHPEKGELRPDEFIPVAEESGAIITLGNWITAKAARVAAEWPDDVTLAVSTSPRSRSARPAPRWASSTRCVRRNCPPVALSWKLPKLHCWITAPTPRPSSTSWPGPACVLRWTISAPAIRPSVIWTAIPSRRSRSTVASSLGSAPGRPAMRSSARWRPWARRWGWRSWPKVWKRWNRCRRCATPDARWVRAGISAGPCRTIWPRCCWRRSAAGSGPMPRPRLPIKTRRPLASTPERLFIRYGYVCQTGYGLAAPI